MARSWLSRGKQTPEEPPAVAQDAPAPADATEPSAPAAPERKGLLRRKAPAPAAEAEPAAGESVMKPAGLFGEKEEAPEPEAPPEPTPIPPLSEGQKELLIYPVQAPYAYVRVFFDEKASENVYQVIEPPLTEREKRILTFVESTMVDILEVGLSEMDEKTAETTLKKNIDDILYDYSIAIDETTKQRLTYYVVRDFLGFAKIDPIMRDDLIEDVSCDGPGVPIFLYHRKFESLRSLVVFETPLELDSFVIRLAQRSGKHISIAEPLLDATMEDGSRLNATLSDEVTAGGSTFTIRKFREEPFTPTDLVKFGTMSAEMLAYLWMAVQHGASTIYSGGTASGKTTSLNAILLFIPPQMKIVSIEDTRELNLPHPNWIAATTRMGFGPRDDKGRQAGEIDMFTLLKAALRQRPEYILVGEVRGQEAYVLFQAMATGHSAYGTMHADSVESVIHRLESDPINIPRSLLEALDIVSVQIQTRIAGKRVRRTKEIVEIVGLDPHTREILTNEVFAWQPATDTFEFSGVSYVLERIRMEKNLSEQEMKDELARRKEIIEWMIAREVRDHKDVARIILSYYRNPGPTMERIRAASEESGAQAAAYAAGSEEAKEPEEASGPPAAPAVAVASEVLAASPPAAGATQAPVSQPAHAAAPSPSPLAATKAGVAARVTAAGLAGVMQLPSVDRDLAMHLAQAGFRDVQAIARASPEDLARVPGVDASLAAKLKSDAQAAGGNP
ncbi:MAG TPA: ATPase, T2SS/T4P/T4SS family [Candidatus Thermoplasmatota archaeon]|nr:ATPase, T2SS/T4P/T4SS family [Candidatus Thermoplasmatota archaeon]